jgi:hypothetical protein
MSRKEEKKSLQYLLEKYTPVKYDQNKVSFQKDGVKFIVSLNLGRRKKITIIFDNEEIILGKLQNLKNVIKKLSEKRSQALKDSQDYVNIMSGDEEEEEDYVKVIAPRFKKNKSKNPKKSLKKPKSLKRAKSLKRVKSLKRAKSLKKTSKLLKHN